MNAEIAEQEWNKAVGVSESVANDNGKATSKPATKKRQAKSESNPKTGEDRLVTSQEIIATLTRLGYSFRLNEATDDIEVSGRPISDGIKAEIRTRMRDLKFKRMTAIEDAYLAHAMHNSYHPIKEYLNSLKWDGNENIRALTSLLHDPHDAFANGDKVVYVWFKHWLTGAVAKVFEQAQNVMLVLEGKQNIGKSTLIEWLASPKPDYFIEAAIRPDDKDDLIRLCSKWIWSVEELGSTTRRADREALKSFITLRDVTVRRPYAHYDVHKPALASLIGSLNSEAGFLTDPTGNRRFLTVTVKHIGWAYRDCIDPSQVWAEAVALYRSGEPWQLDNSERDTQNTINADYEIEDPVENVIARAFEIDATRDDWFTPSDELVAVADLELKGKSKEHAMAIAATLKRLGVRKDRGDNANGIRVRGYFGVRRRT